MKRPPYLIKRKNRQGEYVWYVWKRPAPQIRIRGEYGSRPFMAAYRAALYEGAARAPVEIAKEPPKTFHAAVRAYKRSKQWERLSDATQKQRGNILDRVEAKAGDMPLSDFDKATIVQARDSMKGPGAAKHLIQTLRGFFQWAVEADYVAADPTEGVKVARPKTEGFKPWSDADIAIYEDRWPLGTRQRLWLAILLHTGLRRGDACLLGPRHVKDGVIEFRAEKTGTPIILPMAKDLAKVIAASPTGPETFIATVHGTPMSKEFFGNLFREACNAAGVSKSAHGLRKAAATRLAEAGATVPELNSVFGWTGAKMAMLYVAKADRARLARKAMDRLVTTPRRGNKKR